MLRHDVERAIEMRRRSRLRSASQPIPSLRSKASPPQLGHVARDSIVVAHDRAAKGASHMIHKEINSSASGKLNDFKFPPSPPPSRHSQNAYTQDLHSGHRRSQAHHDSERSRFWYDTVNGESLSRSYPSRSPNSPNTSSFNNKRLAPLSPFNPYARTRAESLSAVIEDEGDEEVAGDLPSPPLNVNSRSQKLRRLATVSNLFSRIHKEAEIFKVSDHVRRY